MLYIVCVSSRVLVKWKWEKASFSIALSFVSLKCCVALFNADKGALFMLVRLNKMNGTTIAINDRVRKRWTHLTLCRLFLFFHLLSIYAFLQKRALPEIVKINEVAIAIIFWLRWETMLL